MNKLIKLIRQLNNSITELIMVNYDKKFWADLVKIHDLIKTHDLVKTDNLANDLLTM